MEYMLSLPISLSGYFWGKLLGRFVIIFVPVFLALFGATIWSTLTKIDVPWDMFWVYSLQLASMIICFLGLSMYISTLSRSQEVAISVAFVIWLIAVAFLDLLLMGIMLRSRMNPDLIIGVGMINPLQVFRTGALALFDPELTVMGPASYYILDTVSRPLFVVFSVLYPITLGGLFAYFGNRYFNRNDVI
jgi:ABC-2 type transport system permease protein